ncbi:MAG: hypothetical protein ABSF96_08150 [Steroidobacteraceae bacterium]
MPRRKKYKFGIRCDMIRSTTVRAAMKVRMNPNKARRASRLDSAFKACGSSQVRVIVSLSLIFIKIEARSGSLMDVNQGVAARSRPRL